MGGGGKSSSSNKTTTVTNQEDNRAAATDNALALSKNTLTNASVNYTVNSLDTQLAALAAMEAGDTVRKALDTNRAVTDRAFLSSERVTGDAFDFSSDVSDDALGLVKDTTFKAFDLVSTRGKDLQDSAFGFAGNVLAGYEEAKKDESERNFQMIIQASMVLGGIYFVTRAMK